MIDAPKMVTVCVDRARLSRFITLVSFCSRCNRGRVDLGGRPPRSPTDPDVHVKCIRLVTLWRCPSHDPAAGGDTLMRHGVLCCLRFAVTVARPHARLASRLLARLCRTGLVTRRVSTKGFTF